MTVFTCEDNFDAMMTCVYEAWASRLGHSNIKLKTEPIGNLELFCDYRHVDADPEKTASVVRSIKSKISYQAYIMIYEAAMSDAEDKLDTIYHFIYFIENQSFFQTKTHLPGHHKIRMQQISDMEFHPAFRTIFLGKKFSAFTYLKRYYTEMLPEIDLIRIHTLKHHFFGGPM